MPETLTSLNTPTNAETLSDAETVALRALGRSEEPLTASQLAGQLSGPYRLSPSAVGALLERQVAAGKLHRFAPYRGKQPRYHCWDADEYASRVMLQLLGERPHTLRDLQNRIAKRLEDCPAARRKQLLERLVERGEVLRLPKLPGSSTQRFSRRPPDPEEYLATLVRRFLQQVETQAERLREVDVPHDKTLQAARRLLQAAWKETAPEASAPEASAPETRVTPVEPPADPLPTQPAAPQPAPAESASAQPPTGGAAAERSVVSESDIQRQLVQLRDQPEGGPLIPVGELRRALGLRPEDKHAFDAMLLGMARRGQVALYRHDYPAGLSEEGRQDLVRDDFGNYYNGVSLRAAAEPEATRTDQAERTGGEGTSR